MTPVGAAEASLRAPARLRGTIRPPSDKSIAHRALIFGALASGRSVVRVRAPGEDVESTVSALRALGVTITRIEQPAGVEFTVDGTGTESEIGRFGGGTADCGNSGTTMRLLVGAVGSMPSQTSLTGDASLSRRPMERIAAPVGAMGATIATTDGHAPITIAGRRPLRALDHVLPVASAQLLAGICTAALAADGRTTVRVPGPTRDHTERMLRAMGSDIARVPAGAGAVTSLSPGPLAPITLHVPGDFSSAAAWVVAASLHRDAEIRLVDVGLNPTRTALLDTLRAMGASVTIEMTAAQGGEPTGDIIVRSAERLESVTVGAAEAASMIDELPLLAVAMAGANGTSEVRGAQELRVKESDRVAAMTAALNAVGAEVEELPDGWRVSRGRPRDAFVMTHADHRIAMAMSVAAFAGVAASVELDDRACVAVSYPSFWDDARRIGAFE